MKYLRLFESFEKDIDKICKKYRIKNYTINPDGSIDVNSSISLYNKGLTKLPLKFNKVDGYFDCSWNNLKTLEGSPIEVNGNFSCVYNKLTSFEYAPKIIRGDFNCENNNIKTFEYFPSFVKGDFYCTGNIIYFVWNLFEDCAKIELLNDFDIFRDEDTDEPAIFIERLNDFLLTIGTIDVNEFVFLSNRGLKKLPLKFNKVNGYFYCSNNELTKLEGSPIEVNGNFSCFYNKLTSFQFAPKIIRGSFYCDNNNIKSFEYFPSFVKEYFNCYDNPIYEVWKLFEDTNKIELLNDFDIFRDEDTDKPAIIMDRLNDFLLTIGKPIVEKVNRYKNI